MTEPTHNLILVYNSTFMPGDDLELIVGKIKEQSPAIETFIAQSNTKSFRTAKLAANRPTLVVSIGPLANFTPKRGKIYQGQIMSKYDQLMRLGAAKLPVPKWILLQENTRLNHAKWGKTVVLKPVAVGSAQGRGVQFVKTKKLGFIPQKAFPENHIGRYAPMLAQEYIETGDYPSEYRVLCFFGRPLYAIKRMSQEKRPQVSDFYNFSDPRDLRNSKGTKHFGFGSLPIEASHITEPDVLELACRAYDAIPEAPLQGVDIIREKGTGNLYIMETNPGGFCWHFSSRIMENAPLIDGIRKEDQMDAFSVAADILVQRTLAEAQ